MRKPVALLIITCFLFASCRKYEEGPDFTLLSKKARLCGNWTIELLLKNGQDATTAFYPNYGYQEYFGRDGTYTYKVFGSQPHTGYGKWRWSQHKFEIIRTESSNAADKVIHILKLENRSLWYNYHQGRDHYEVHLVNTDEW